MTKTLQIKQGSEWTNDLGQTFPAAPLYQFTDENGDGSGVWYSTVERAESSWARWIALAPARERRSIAIAMLAYEARAAHAAALRNDPLA